MSAQAEFLTTFLKHEGDLRAFIGSLVQDRHAREDVMQEVALIAWNKFDTYDSQRSFGAWARGIAVNMILKLRERTARSAVPFSPDTVQAVLDAANRAEAGSSPWIDKLERCVEQLPEKSRRLLALRYEESLEMQQIADRVQSTAEAVHKALSRLRLRLRECVESRLATTGDERQ